MPAWRRADHSGMDNGTDGGWQPGVEPGQYDGAGVLRHGDEFDVCDRGDPGHRRRDPGILDVDTRRRTDGPYGRNVVRSVHLSRGGGDGDQIIFRFVTVDNGGKSVPYQQGHQPACRVPGTEGAVYWLSRGVWGRNYVRIRRNVRMWDELVYLYPFSPGPRRVGRHQGFPDEQNVRAVWIDETRRQTANADRFAIEVKKGVYSITE